MAQEKPAVSTESGREGYFWEEQDVPPIPTPPAYHGGGVQWARECVLLVLKHTHSRRTMTGFVAATCAYTRVNDRSSRARAIDRFSCLRH